MMTSGVIAQERDIELVTYHYATHDGVELRMDIYRSSLSAELSPRPCVIFMFGGGFVGGERDNEVYMGYFEGLARQGIVVASIDYRLGLAGIGGDGDMDVKSMVGAMSNAVNIAVEDLYAATNYILLRATELNVDRDRIVISGSSAGAIAALQAEWLMCAGDARSEVLPADFRYGGVVACAGAIFSTSGRPKFNRPAAPMMLFHGTSDRNVPYDRASILGVGFYGSSYIAKQLDKHSSPYYFYSVEYADHSLATTPLVDKVALIIDFIDEYVIRGRSWRTIVEVVDVEGDKLPTRFSVMDYLHANYSR